NDADALVFPGADERCNGADDDCDGEIDDGLDETWFRDRDGDGFGGDESVESCTAPVGYASQAGDCDDLQAAINPGAVEVCDVAGVDDDCDALVNEDDPGLEGGMLLYTDADG